MRKVGEVFGALHHGASTLKTHTGIHVARRKVPEAPVLLRVVLDEHEVPYLNAFVTAGVHQCSLSVPLRREIHMQLRARPAGPRLSHHPEVVVRIAIHHMHLRIHSLARKERRPCVVRLLVEFTRIPFPGRIHRSIEPLHREAPTLHNEFPCPRNCLLFEVIAERPVAQHFEKGVVIGILPHVLKIIVLATGTNALLRIRGTRRLPGRGPYSQKIRHELIHPRICEEQPRTLRHQRCRRHYSMSLLAEKI